MSYTTEIPVYAWKVYVFLAGDTRMHLCTCANAENAAAIVRSLCGADRPQFMRVELEAESDFRAL